MNRLFSLLLIVSTVSALASCRKPSASAAKTDAVAPQALALAGQTTAQPSGAAAPTAAPPKPMPAQLPAVLARVNGEAVTKADFDRLIKNMEVRANQPIPAERRDAIFRQALDQLVTYTVLTQETRTRKVTVSDEEVDHTLKQMRSQFPSEDEFKKALDLRGMTLDRLKSDTRIDIGINKMMETEVSSQAAPSDADCRAFYDKFPEKFKQDESVRASHILFRVDDNADAATKKKAMDQAQAVLKEARNGADFGELAKKHSADGSAQQGGDLNYFTHGQMVPPFDQAAFALKPGEISDIVTTQFGYHIIKVTDHKPASTVPFEQVSGRIKDFLGEQKKQQKVDEFIQSLKKKANIEVLV